MITGKGPRSYAYLGAFDHRFPGLEEGLRRIGVENPGELMAWRQVIEISTRVIGRGDSEVEQDILRSFPGLADKKRWNLEALETALGSLI